jgi:hypothetical protein
MWFDQEGKCAICKEPETTRVLSIDHCHKTNKVRGLLCQRCNLGLGNFLDSRGNLQSAIDYLHKTTETPNEPLKSDQTSLMQDLVRDAAKHRAENQILRERLSMVTSPPPPRPAIEIGPYFVWLREQAAHLQKWKEKRPSITTIESRIQHIEDEMDRLKRQFPGKLDRF